MAGSRPHRKSSPRRISLRIISRCCVSRAGADRESALFACPVRRFRYAVEARWSSRFRTGRPNSAGEGVWFKSIGSREGPRFSATSESPRARADRLCWLAGVLPRWFKGIEEERKETQTASRSPFPSGGSTLGKSTARGACPGRRLSCGEPPPLVCACLGSPQSWEACYRGMR